MGNKRIGLYIHIPFCKLKCRYCDFNSSSGKEDLFPQYFDTIQKELKYYTEILSTYIIDTVFIGGGTPSLVDAEYIEGLLKLCRSQFSIDAQAEITIESNPGTLTTEKLIKYHESGINRLSIGLQAWQDKLLNKLGRIHSSEDFTINYNAALNAGFKNINADLIFGLPGQTMNDWIETVQNIIKLGLQHISCYSLKIEEGTVFGDMQEKGLLEPIDDELDRQMYWYAVDELKKYGYIHYEISNFAMPGFECRHNLRYWKAEEYIGIGAGAHSYFQNNRFNNVCGIEEYMASKNTDIASRENVEYIGRTESMSEYLILGLRLNAGVIVDDFKLRYGMDIFEVYSKQVEILLKKRLIDINCRRIYLTNAGLDLANEVFVEFI